MKKLILTGWGWKDYACAAALALRYHRQADVLGMSTRRLPEFLHEVQGYQEIVIVGVGLTGNPVVLEKALARLAKKGVKVQWISALPIPESLSSAIRSRLDIFVGGGADSLTSAVSQRYRLPCDDVMPLVNEDTTPQNSRPLHLLIEAAMYDYRNYQNEKAYGSAIRHIADNDPMECWTEQERRMVERYKRFGNRELVGASKAIAALRDQVNRVAPHDHARVLIYGESGTGKETVALQIHLKSPRRNEPFIAFNCANITPELLESRLLGHEKGAFTGATEIKRGVFEQADGGTLFLDEIGELPLEAQGLLLRVLEGGRFMRIGEKEEIEVNVRLITATNRDLCAMVRERTFREDLFHRLNVIQLRTPALREHKEDIEKIANAYWLRQHRRWLTADQAEALKSYDYPGNVRELFNLLERATVLGETDFSRLLAEHRMMSLALPSTASANVPDNLEQAIARHIRRVHEKYGSNVSKTAEMLGKSRNTVRKYLG